MMAHTWEVAVVPGELPADPMPGHCGRLLGPGIASSSAGVNKQLVVDWQIGLVLSEYGRCRAELVWYTCVTYLLLPSTWASKQRSLTRTVRIFTNFFNPRFDLIFGRCACGLACNGPGYVHERSRISRCRSYLFGFREFLKNFARYFLFYKSLCRSYYLIHHLCIENGKSRL